MNSVKVGELIRSLRRESGMTQLQLAGKLHVSDKTVSKWERGLGCPDVSLIPQLSLVFEVDMNALLSGELNRNKLPGGNLRKLKIYLCPYCGNLITSTTDLSVACCGRKLKAETPVKAADEERLTVQIIEHDYFISSSHEMTKDHCITFVALVTSDAMLLRKQYPEWDLQTRIPMLAHGRLLWHCSRHGLFYQEV